MIYLNNAAGSFPKPDSVRKALERMFTSPPSDSFRGGNAALCDRDDIEEARVRTAAFFNTPNPEDVFFTSGATFSLNLLLRGAVSPDCGFPWKMKAQSSPFRMVTTLTEHNSVLRPLNTLARERTVEVSMAGCDRYGYIDSFSVRELLKPGARVLVVNHCSNVTGAIQDLKDFGRLARNAGALFIVDASQSAGIIPIDVQALEADALVFAGHKYLFGLPGSGGFYLRPGIFIPPLVSGGTGIRSDAPFQPEARPLCHEAGTRNTPGILSIAAGISFLREKGFAEVSRIMEAHTATLLDGLGDIKGITLHTAGNPQRLGGVVSFSLYSVPPEDVCYLLEQEYGIIIRCGLHCAPLIHGPIGSAPRGTVRVSYSILTPPDHIGTFVSVMKEIAGAFS